MHSAADPLDSLPPPRFCVADLITHERHILRELTLNGIQVERTIELFSQRLLKLSRERDALEAQLGLVKKDLHRHSLVAELSSLPVELSAYVGSVVPSSVSASWYSRGDGADEEGAHSLVASMAIPCAQLPSPDHLLFGQCLRDERVCTSLSPLVDRHSNQGRLVPLHKTMAEDCSAFIPLRGTDGRSIIRRPATAHFAICESNQLDVGRCLASRSVYHGGDLLFLEHPFLTLCTSASRQVLTKEYARVLDRVVDKRSVLEAKGWDERLAVAFIAYLCELSQCGDPARLRSAVASLCCPLQSIDAERLMSLCEYAHFLHAALPTSISDGGNASEDDIVGFFVALQSNAVVHGQRGGGALFSSESLQIVTSAEEKLSLFGFTALIQHSCNPNAVLTVRPMTDVCESSGPDALLSSGGGGYVVELRALRTIGVGEAISIAYCSALPPTAQRRKALRARYFFDCMCSRCTVEADYTRRFIGSRGQVICPIGEGGQWLNGDAVLKSDDASVIPLIRMEARLLDQAAASLPSLGHWAQILEGWESTNCDGFARLSATHFALVTSAVMLFTGLAREGPGPSAAREVGVRYLHALVGATLGASAVQWASAGDVGALALCDFQAVDHAMAAYCLLPVVEAAAAACDGTVGCTLWYLAFRLLSTVCQQGSGERAVRAKLMAAPLLE